MGSKSAKKRCWERNWRKMKLLEKSASARNLPVLYYPLLSVLRSKRNDREKGNWLNPQECHKTLLLHQAD